MKRLRDAVLEMTPGKVDAWLNNLDDSFQLQCNDCYGCLFAQYLTEVIERKVDVGKQIAHVDLSVRELQTGDFETFTSEEVPLPSWACDVISRFDDGPFKARGPKSSRRILQAVCGASK